MNHQICIRLASGVLAQAVSQRRCARIRWLLLEVVHYGQLESSLIATFSFASSYLMASQHMFCSGFGNRHTGTSAPF